MPAKDEGVRVAIVGSGIAGLTAALRLSQRGYQVTVYEAKNVLGGNLAAEKVNGVYHDVYPHMFCDWYDNFWNIFENDLGRKREAHFEARYGIKMLLKGSMKYLDLRSPNTLRAVLANMRSGVLPVPDFFLWAFSMLDLASQPFQRREFLSQYSVNGFLRSRSYATDPIAMLHDLVLMEIWSVHGVQTSAHAYKDFVKHTFGVPRSAPFAWMLKGNLYEKLIGPLEQELRDRGCRIETGRRVDAVSLEGGVEIELAGGEKPETDYVILAVPAEELGRLVTKGVPGQRIVDQVPYLSEVRRLRAEPIPVLDLYFKRKLIDIPKEHVGLSWSGYSLTFFDISQLWVGDPNMRDRTVLVLAASDAYALPSQCPQENAHLMIKRLHEYLPVFKPGKHWGDPMSDILWEKSHCRSNLTNQLFINEVGSGGWRPQASYAALPYVFFAGDAVPTEVSMATIEAAVRSGLNAARALWEREQKGAPIELIESDVPNDGAFLAWKLALTPYAYWAKWWSTAFTAVPQLAKGDLVRGLASPAATMLSLPHAYVGEWWQTATRLSYAYVGECWQTASRLWARCLRDRKGSRKRR